MNAVARVAGLELLAEFEEEDMPEDEDFFVTGSEDHVVPGTIYMVLSNQQALQQLLALWQQYLANPTGKFERGLTPFRDLFALLRDIRPWGPEDRIKDTGLLVDWRSRVSQGEEALPAEIELWFKSSEGMRDSSERAVIAAIEGAGGRLITRAVIPEIRYHAVLANLPVASVQQVLAQVDAISLIRADQVMFVRPVGQSVDAWVDDALPGESEAEVETTATEPLVALLDGLPIEQHVSIAGRVVIDDPDGRASDYPARERRHGTAMASLLIRGDLSEENSAVARSIYVRPILQPAPDWVRQMGQAPEKIPDDELTVDLIHRAVRRLFEGEGSTAAVAPSVVIINLSIGDSTTQFAYALSAWARLVDWLAWRYRVLVIVSAGNHSGQIVLPIARASLGSLSAEQIQSETLRAINADAANRRLLAPSESVNSITVGAAHEDSSGPFPPDGRRELITSSWLPGPFSALGLGFRRAVKPDILMPGGRQLYDVQPSVAAAETVLRPSAIGPPGLLVASPGQAGVLSAVAHHRGTSGATALATRAAAEIHDALHALGEESKSLRSRDVLPCVLKALLVHGAEWGEGVALLHDAIGMGNLDERFRKYAGRFLGYGRVDPTRALGSEAYRSLMVGAGELVAGQASIFRVPLPPGLISLRGRRRLTVTLAWLTPINPRDRRYRRALLWFDPPHQELGLDRIGVQWQAVRRGTLQHEILEGEKATVFSDGDALAIRVSCAKHAGELEEAVPFGLAVSLEVAPELQISVFEEVRARLRAPVRVVP